MDTSKYDRTIGLFCPTCGCSQFEHNENANEIVKCASCGRELTRDELIHENNENISEHVKEIGQQVVKDVTKEFRESLKKMFAGSKNIRIK